VQKTSDSASIEVVGQTLVSSGFCRIENSLCAALPPALGQIGDAQAVSGLIQALQYREEFLRSEVAEALARCAGKMVSIRTAKRAAHALWWCLTDRDGADVAFRSLEQIANRLSVLEVEVMPLVDPLLPEPKRIKKH
jgi:HEAT repeat protein